MFSRPLSGRQQETCHDVQPLFLEAWRPEKAISGPVSSREIRRWISVLPILSSSIYPLPFLRRRPTCFGPFDLKHFLSGKRLLVISSSDSLWVLRRLIIPQLFNWSRQTDWESGCWISVPLDLYLVWQNSDWQEGGARCCGRSASRCWIEPNAHVVSSPLLFASLRITSPVQTDKVLTTKVWCS